MTVTSVSQYMLAMFTRWGDRRRRRAGSLRMFEAIKFAFVIVFVSVSVFVFVIGSASCNVALSKPTTTVSEAGADKSAKSGPKHVLQGGVSQSELIDNLERVGVKCGVVDGKPPTLVVIDVHRGTSAFNKGLENGDQIGDVRPGNGGINLTFKRGGQVYQVFLRSSAVPFTEQINHSQLEAEISEAAKQRIKKLTALNTNTGDLAKVTLLDAIDGVHMSALRRTDDTPIVEKQTLEGLRWVPQTARAIVWDSGIRVLITPSILELDEFFKTAKPRGVHGGYTAVGGLFLGSLIAISERVQYRNNTPQLVDSRGTICHEFGHAYDASLGRKFGTFKLFTATTKFEEIYHDDETRLTNDQRRNLEYYTQPDGAGESECFAQLFSDICSAEAKPGKDKTELEKGFPKTKALIKSVMLDPQLCQGLTEE
jgi:hypothetical protein